MKTRFVTSLAAAAVVTLGLTSCGLIAPQRTLDPYAPSDGVEFTLGDIDVRNLMLITDADGEQFNVVFGGVNNGDSSVSVGIRFVSEDGSALASADFDLDPGYTSFGDLEGDEGNSTIVSLDDTSAGSMVTAFVQVPGGDVEKNVPVLDGTLRTVDGEYAFPEYMSYVP